MKLHILNPEKKHQYEVPIEDLSEGEWFYWADNLYMRLSPVDRPDSPDLINVVRMTNTELFKIGRTLYKDTMVQPIESQNIIIKLKEKKEND